MASSEVVQELAITAELCGSNLSPAAAKALLHELENESELDLLTGLKAMRREHDGRFSLAAVLRYVKAAQKARVASIQTCWVCGAPALAGTSACGAHLDTDRQWEARRIGSIPVALVPRKSA